MGSNVACEHLTQRWSFCVCDPLTLQANADAVTLANLMPQRWAGFIRNAPMEEVKPIGTKPLRL